MKLLLTMALVLTACSRGSAPPATSAARSTTTTTTTLATTTTAAEPEPVRALRAYFDAYAKAVQTNDPDSILPFLDRDNEEIVQVVTRSIRRDHDAGDSGSRSVSAIFVEWERSNADGDPIVSVRAIYSYERGAEAKSYGLVRLGGKWLLTAISREAFD